MKPTESELVTLRVALTRLRLELEKNPGLLGPGANAEALRLEHLRNVRSLTMQTLQEEG